MDGPRAVAKRKSPSREHGHPSKAKAPLGRRLKPATLAGRHTHVTTTGVELHIWKRPGRAKGRRTGEIVDRYVARFHYQGGRPGHTLGEGIDKAEAELRRVMMRIEDGTYVAPSSPEAKRRKNRAPIPHLTLTDLNADYIASIRRSRGKDTARTYAGRLAHVEAFAQQEHIRRRYPLAEDVDPDFVVELGGFLRTRTVSRNGRRNGEPTLMSPSTRREVLERLKAVLTWGSSPAVRKLPAEFVQPVTKDLIGGRPAKDPFGPLTFPLERRLRLVQVADSYQLTALSLQLVLPLRPEQVAGLLIPEVNWSDRTLCFGTRFDGNDFTKSGATFRLPFPRELEPLLRAAVGDRVDGPVFLKRSVIEGRTRPEITVARPGDLVAAVNKALLETHAEDLQADGDAKRICRRTIAAAGGVTGDDLRDEFLKLVCPAGIIDDVRYYDLRSDVISEMKAVGVDAEYLRYALGHKEVVGGSLEKYLKLQNDSLSTSFERYWTFTRELLKAIAERATWLGLAGHSPATIRMVPALTGVA